MKKKILLLFIMVFVSIGIVSCSNNIGITETDTTEETTTEDTTIDETTTEGSTTEETTTDGSTTEETTTEGSTTEETTTEETTTEETTTEETTTEETTTEEQNLITELFFSEYGEGSSYNKWIEIYNGTGETVDLSSYTVELYSNDNTSPSQTVNLSGTIDNNDVYVIAHGSSDSTILAQADLVNNNVANWNGNDAITLVKDSNIIDIIGTIGDEVYFAEEITLVRKDEIIAPNDVYDENEWNEYGIDTFDYIGSHSNVGPDESILLQQDIDALPNEISLYNNYTLGQGSNGSTYTITSVDGDASSYVEVLADDNTIEVILDTEVAFFSSGMSTRVIPVSRFTSTINSAPPCCISMRYRSSLTYNLH
ncbi:MAG: lamin tail domain-containing protein, partial [Candidatus Izemoplasmatales bacterium]